MTILIVALVMASAMMAAAFYSMYMEGRAELFRRLRVENRGRFADSERR